MGGGKIKVSIPLFLNYREGKKQKHAVRQRRHNIKHGDNGYFEPLHGPTLGRWSDCDAERSVLMMGSFFLSRSCARVSSLFLP